MFRVTIAQFDGATTLRAPPLAAGLLAATLRREAGLADAIDVLAARRAPDATAAALADADLAGVSRYTWNQRYALEVARRARARRPGLRIVAGGPSVVCSTRWFHGADSRFALADDQRVDPGMPGMRGGKRRRPRRIAVRAIPWPLAVERAARLDAFLALGWARQPRGQIEPLGEPPAGPPP